ncbi:hypothetical protein B0O99DRAFT_16972 [Bisporella sp. PMI_857]|nr:hypothetical protein B0O99DRAFT_16972 [Bisporella sp. PMI_857]
MRNILRSSLFLLDLAQAMEQMRLQHLAWANLGRLACCRRQFFSLRLGCSIAPRFPRSLFPCRDVTHSTGPLA